MSSTVPALERAITVMQALADGGESSSLGLARRLGISQSSCYRTLQTLQQADWIRPADEGYVFSDGLRPLLLSLLDRERLLTRLRRPMTELAQRVGLSVKLSVREGAEQVTLARAESPRPLMATSPVGARFPVVLGASGAALLSALDDAALARQLAYAHEHDLWAHESEGNLRERLLTCRRDGLCENLGHHPQGIDTVSAPLALEQGPFALTLVGLQGDLHDSHLAECRVALRSTVASIQQMEALA